VHDAVLVDHDHRVRHGVENGFQVRLAGERILRAGGGAFARAQQLLASPRHADADRHEGEQAAHLRHAGMIAADDAEERQRRAERGRQQPRPQSPDTGPQQHRRHKKQVRRGIAEQREKHDAGPERRRDARKRQSVVQDYRADGLARRQRGAHTGVDRHGFGHQCSLPAAPRGASSGKALREVI
jgi:hypothetical protein